MLPKTLNHNMYMERDHLKIYQENIFIQLTDRHMAKSGTFKNNIILVIIT
jgi:hypothetical protein